jgi:hypothetical protein
VILIGFIDFIGRNPLAFAAVVLGLAVIGARLSNKPKRY